MPRSPSRTLPRNLKKGGAVAGMSGALFPPTSAGGKTGKFMHSRKCEISRLLGCAQHPLEGAGWDEELSNIGS